MFEELPRVLEVRYLLELLSPSWSPKNQNSVYLFESNLNFQDPDTDPDPDSENCKRTRSISYNCHVFSGYA